MRQSSFSLGRVFGIDVRVHATWLLAFAFITWSLAGGYFRFVVPRQGLGTPLLLGAISALLLFASVLVHEFSHSLVARALGLRVRDITLFIFGGVSNIGGEARTARDEFLIAFVGPLTSFVLAAVFWVVAASVGSTAGVGLLFGSVRGLGTPLSAPGAVLSYLAVINLILGAFNLIPAFPLDGGRVFRSILWGITRRYERATAIAAIVGQAFGYLLVAFGLVRVLAFGDVVGGMWTLFIGWFLGQAASATRRERRLRSSMRGVAIGRVMNAAPTLVQAGSSLQQLVLEQLLPNGEREAVVVRNGRPLGLIDAASVRRVPRDLWATTPVEHIMRTIGESVTPDMEVAELLDRLQEFTATVPVVVDERLVGVVDLRQLLRSIQLHAELQVSFATTRPATV
jgi:Zn-dependent protease